MDDALSDRKAAVAAAAIGEGLIDEEQPVAGLIDIDGLRRAVSELQDSFPPHFVHAFACKASSLVGVLQIVREAGMACEVASPGEVLQAHAAGFPAERIIYDSPAKTLGELAIALERGMLVNIDNFQELERVDGLVARRGASRLPPIGIRINPQVGVGTIAAMSTATRTSKFGVALEDEGNRERLIAAYRERPWLTAVHTHVGSQGCPLELIGGGVAKAVELALAINEAIGRPQVATVDIGGGLPVNFESDTVTPTFADYATALRRAAPALFTGGFQVITEFGRSILAKNGFILARVEYTKTTGGRAIAITHAGAQVATRTVFMPEMWALRISALDREGRPKGGERLVQDIAGPCCFAGDIIAHRRLLPRLEPGDHVLLHDTGAYYFSTPFVYNSLPRVAVHGFSLDGPRVGFTLLRRAETLREVLAASALPG